MNKPSLQPMIGICGINDPFFLQEITACVSVTPERPLCISVNLTASALEHGHPALIDTRNVERERVKEIFSQPVKNTIFLVHYFRESPTDTLPDGNALCRAFETGGSLCHGIRLEFDDMRTDALIEFRTKYPNALIILDITSTAFRERIGEGNIHTLLGLIEGYTEEYDEPLIDHVYIQIDERKGGRGFPLRQGLQLLNILMHHKLKNCAFGISGTINESLFGLFHSTMHNWKDLSVDAGEALRETGTGALRLDRVCNFLNVANETFNK